jgi:phospholipid/cholesterol/gamma-HCH transport system permease protein
VAGLSTQTEPPPASPLILAFVGSIGRSSLGFAGEVGDATLFLGRASSQMVRRPFRFGLILEQAHFIGNRSLTVVMLTSAFTGLVLALQGYNALVRFGAEQMVGTLVALSLVRELAPVLGALMITARAGSAIAATLADMRVTEQIDALETMAIDPISYLVVPPLFSTLLVVPMLTAIFSLTGLAVAQAFGVSVLGLERASFVASVKSAIQWSDVLEGLTKSLTFALLMVWIATYRGYNARGGARGVGQAATRAVVETAVLVFATDYILTALLF